MSPKPHRDFVLSFTHIGSRNAVSTLEKDRQELEVQIVGVHVTGIIDFPSCDALSDETVHEEVDRLSGQ